MSTPLYSIPGSTPPASTDQPESNARTVAAVLASRVFKNPA